MSVYGKVVICLGAAALLSACQYPRTDTAPLPAPDRSANARLLRDFQTFDPDYQAHRDLRAVRLKALSAKVLAMELRGEPATCSSQILLEANWLLNSSAHWNEIDERLDTLEKSLNDPVEQAIAETADPKTGLWGACYKAFYLKLNDTYDRLERTSAGNEPPHPLPPFLSGPGAVDGLPVQLGMLAISDVAGTGVDHEREYNDMLATLLQMIVLGKPQNYQVDPRLKASFTDFVVHKLRDPATGWWGEGYQRDGQDVIVDDLNITFRVVSYLKGQVPELSRVIDTALKVKDLDYPVGWKWKGSYWNHSDMEAVTLFAYAWPLANFLERDQMATETDKMLTWCLQSSLQSDGSFKPIEPDASIEEAETYGVQFLVRVGYFDPSRRFWTNRDFPEAEGVRRRIVSFAKSHMAAGGSGGNSYKSILDALNARSAQ